jgi:hypothetical protein
MRLNARTGAALLAIFVGLALIAFAALGSKGSLPGTLKAAPDLPAATGAIPPLETDTGVTSRRKGLTNDQKPTLGVTSDIFDSEYGDRGEHEVSVSISASGTAGYLIKWRDGKSEKGTTSGLTRARTVRGGFPLAQIGVQGLPAAHVTCTITVDGVQKASKSSQKKYGIALCTG